MSRHSENASIARANHTYYFGETTGVEWRSTKDCDWTTLVGAVVHGEEIKSIRRGNSYAKIIRRQIFVESGTVTLRLHSHVRIGGDCGQIYTVADITTKGSRICLHLQREHPIEITNPNYRSPNRR